MTAVEYFDAVDNLTNVKKELAEMKKRESSSSRTTLAHIDDAVCADLVETTTLRSG